MNVIYIYKLIGKLTCTIFRIYYLDIAIDNGNIICKFCIVRVLFFGTMRVISHWHRSKKPMGKSKRRFPFGNDLDMSSKKMMCSVLVDLISLGIMPDFREHIYTLW